MPTAAPRWILHVDLDQFLASVELLRHPELAGLPVIVGGNGDPTEPRKVVTCASYEARAYGVRAGMPLRTAARRCPEATFLPSNPAAYNAASEEVVALLRDLGYPVEVWGWDEAYLAVAPGTPDDPIEVAEEIRKVILSQTGLSCSIGISDNKQRAKIATGLAKPAGIYQLTDANWMAIMGDRTVEALWGGAQDYEKAGKAWDQHRLPTCTHRFRAIDVHVRSANRAVAAAGQMRRRYRSQCPSLGSTLAQPRRHLSTRPHLPIRNGIGRDGIGAANTQRGGGFVANRHPSRGHRAHGDVLHPHQDPKAASSQHRSRRHHRCRPARS